MDGLFLDLKYAVRSLLCVKGFSLLCVVYLCDLHCGEIRPILRL